MHPVRHRLSSPRLVQFALGLVYFHFGFLKWFPDLSPAELLATQTVLRFDLGLEANDILRLLAGWECAVGALLMLNVWRRLAAILLLGHLVGTFMPLVLLPELAFRVAPFAPTLEGQYVLKNLVFAAIGLQLLLGPSKSGRPDSTPTGSATTS